MVMKRSDPQIAPAKIKTDGACCSRQRASAPTAMTREGPLGPGDRLGGWRSISGISSIGANDGFGDGSDAGGFRGNGADGTNR